MERRDQWSPAVEVSVTVRLVKTCDVHLLATSIIWTGFIMQDENLSRFWNLLCINHPLLAFTTGHIDSWTYRSFLNSYLNQFLWTVDLDFPEFRWTYSTPLSHLAWKIECPLESRTICSWSTAKLVIAFDIFKRLTTILTENWTKSSNCNQTFEFRRTVHFDALFLPGSRPNSRVVNIHCW